MSYTSPKGVVFDGRPCGECGPCETRAKITRTVDEIIAETEPEIERARVEWQHAREDVDELRVQLRLDPYSAGLTVEDRWPASCSLAEQWREEVVALCKARDERLARAITNGATIPACAWLRYTPRISNDCTDFDR